MDASLQAVSEAIFMEPWLGAAPASVLLQAVALVRLKGTLRGISLILAVITGAVGGLALAAYQLAPGNLWELLLMLASPPMLVLTAGVLLMGLVVLPRTPPASSATHAPAHARQASAG